MHIYIYIEREGGGRGAKCSWVKCPASLPNLKSDAVWIVIRIHIRSVVWGSKEALQTSVLPTDE